MRLLKVSSVFLFVAVSGVLHAGHDLGNGGDAIVCPDEKGDRVTLFDHFEGALEYGYDLSLLSSFEGDYRAVVLGVLSRLHRINPSRAEKYLGWFDEMEYNVPDEERKVLRFLRGMDLVDIPDAGVGFLPEGCSLQQFAIQRRTPSKAQARYYVDGELWDLASEETRAGLILHELIVREKLSGFAADKSTENARRFNALVSSTEFEKLSLKEYLELSEEMRFANADAHGFRLALHLACRGLEDCERSYFDDNRLKTARLSEARWSSGLANIHVSSGRIEFDQGSRPVSVDGVYGELSYDTEILKGDFAIASLDFKNGELIAARLAGSRTYEGSRIVGKNFEIVLGKEYSSRALVEFYKNGMIKSIEKIDGGVVLRKGVSVKLRPGSRVKFGQDGSLVESR